MRIQQTPSFQAIVSSFYSSARGSQFEEPPQIASVRYGSESPDLVQRALASAPRPPEVEGLMAQAEDLFQNGKRLYLQGDIAGARREFDRSLDVLLSAPENLPDRQRLERKLDQMAESIYRYDLEGLGAQARSRRLFTTSLRSIASWK